MKKTSILLLSIVVFSCSTPNKAVKTSSITNETVATTSKDTKDGLTIENAIIIKAKNEQEGVAKEYTWLKNNYPGYRVKSQGLSSKGSKNYDVIHIVTSDGTEKTVYFDITNFFGKF